MLQEKDDEKIGVSKSNHERIERSFIQFFKDLDSIFSQPLFTKELVIEQSESILPRE